MRSNPKYGVQFVGYSAQVLSRKKDRDVKYAYLDFVTGSTSLEAEGGRIDARDLSPVVYGLPSIVGELEELLKESASAPDGQVCRGPYSAMMPERLSGDRDILIVLPNGAEIRFTLGFNFRLFIRNAVKRFAKVERVIVQAKIIGNSINRRSYDEY